jgi:nucleoside-diphosphate-sugar epimerase
LIQGKKILITGGAGFIGSSLALRLFEHNELTILDNLHRNAIQYTPLVRDGLVTLVEGDVCDPDVVRDAVRGKHHVVHMASIAGVDTVMKNPVKTMNVALKGTINVLEACMNEDAIERIIDFSTSEVFGRYAYKVTEGSVHELGAVGEARWTYAVAKLATEHLALSYHKEKGLPTTSIRPFNIYGPRQVGEGAIHHFVTRALRNDDILVHNDGSQIRSWCFIDDIVEGVLATMELPAAVGETFNIGNPRSTITIYNLAHTIKRLVGASSEISCIPWDSVDVELRIPDIEKAKRVLGFSPTVDLEEGLLRTIHWYRTVLS